MTLYVLDINMCAFLLHPWANDAISLDILSKLTNTCEGKSHKLPEGYVHELTYFVRKIT